MEFVVVKRREDRQEATRKGDEEMEIGQPPGSYHSTSPLLPLSLGEANQIKKPKGLYTPYTLYTIEDKMPEKGKVSITVKRETAEILAKEKSYGESWDELLSRLVKGEKGR